MNFNLFFWCVIKVKIFIQGLFRKKKNINFRNSATYDVLVNLRDLPSDHKNVLLDVGEAAFDFLYERFARKM